MSTTRRFLPRLGHHLQVVPEAYQIYPRVPDGGKSRSISCHQGKEEGAHASDNPPNEETSCQDQQLFAMVHETINAPVNHPSSDIDQVLFVNRANTRTLKASYIFIKAKTNLSLHQLIDRGANGALQAQIQEFYITLGIRSILLVLTIMCLQDLMW